jgi:transposase
MVGMASRSGPVHVATTRRDYNGKVYVTTLLRRTYREDGKVKHQTVGNLSHLPPHTIDLVRRSLSGELPPGGGGFEIVRSLPHGHVAAVLGTLRQIGLDRIIGSQPSFERTLVVAMIVMRIIRPGSKLATARRVCPESTCCSLGLELDIEHVSERQFYEAMDWLLKRQGRIEAKLAKIHLRDGTLVLYDVSSSYYTGKCCSLAKFGHNRDGKNGFPQIVYGLLCSPAGCPVAIEVFEGNTGDPKTLGAQITKVRGRFGLRRVVMVGDRGMITAKRIDEELRSVDGLDWITALRSDAIKRLVEQEVVQPQLFDERDLAEVSSPDYPGERLIVCRNPALAHERARKREELLQATEKELEKIAAATRRPKRGLAGKDKIGLRVGKVIQRHKMAKHFNLEIEEKGFSYQRKKESIAEEAALDGFYVIRTSVPRECLGPESTVRAYKDLAKVERAFRSLKTVDLKVRPIHHWLEGRVRAHVFLCMLAYYVEWHMREKLRPMLFDDEDKEAAEARRTSIVVPAPRSDSARHKDATKRSDADEPVHSFQTLLDDLATLTKNRVRTSGVGDAGAVAASAATAPAAANKAPAAANKATTRAPAATATGTTGDHAAEFYMLATPTQIQQHALNLLGVPLAS